MDDVRGKLQNRLHITSPMIDVMVDVIDRYQASVNIRNLVTGNLILFDDKNRRVGFAYCSQSGKGSYSLDSFDSDWDVVVLVYDSIVLGWVSGSDVNQSLFHQGHINAMPESFDFSIECLHLSENGGYTLDYERWICFGCGKELVFSDKKR